MILSKKSIRKLETMASLITHPLIPIAARIGLGNQVISDRLLIAGMMASMVPDADVITFSFDIPYASPWGHRGFTHSFAFAAFLGLVAAWAHQTFHATRKTAFWLVFLSCASHAILDAMTDGGLGSAFFWPLSDARYFLPWQPIEVSPIGLSRFLSDRGLTVLASEMIYVWLPLAALTSAIRAGIKGQRLSG